MSKPSWRAKVMYIVFAFALIFGVSAIVASPPTAEASVPQDGSFTITGGHMTIDGTTGLVEGYYTGANNGIPNGPYYVEAWANIWIDDAAKVNPPAESGDWWAKAYVDGNRINFKGDSGYSGGTITVDFSGGTVTVGTGGVLTIVENGTVSIVPDVSGANWLAEKDGLIGIPELLPGIALDVKGSIQKFVIVNLPLFQQEGDQNPGMHMGLMEQDWVDMINSEGLEYALEWIQQYEYDEPWVGPWPLNTKAIQQWVILPGVNLTLGDIEVVAGGNTDIPHPDHNKPFIEVRSAKPGDAHFTVWLWWIGPGDWYLGEPFAEEALIQLDTVEKKWGIISDSDLDVDANTDGLQHEKLVLLERYSDGNTDIIPHQEILEETVKAVFMWGDPAIWEEYTAGHAIVHWWLFDATTENEAYIQDLMDLLQPVNDGWTAVGYYDPPPAETPFDYINALLTMDLDEAGPGDDGAADTTEWKDEVGGSEQDPNLVYIQTVTEDDFPGEVRGRTQAELHATAAEEVMIVTLAEYPIDYHGENPVAVQKGKKTFTEQPPPPDEVQVKLPRIKWAGEKLVLEKYWGEGFVGRGVTFQLEHPGLGTLEAITGSTFGEIVFTTVGEDGVARCILDSEDPGQADVKVVLYTFQPLTSAGGEILQGPNDWTQIESEHAFVVFYLNLEEVTPVNSDPLAVDPGMNARFGVQVKGWFTNSNPSMRPAKEVDWDGDGNPDAINPAGRWVLPDDWPVLAGADPMLLRAHWDLMDNWTDLITAGNPLGPYNTNVRTPPIPLGGPGEAQYPVIGPNSWLQPFTTENMWDASAVVPADAMVDDTPDTLPRDSDDVRNTVVPNGVVEWQDAIMPAARIWFRVTGTTLSEVSKTAFAPYMTQGPGGPIYQAPYYAVEIPNSMFIPPLSNVWSVPPFYAPEGYWVDSWGFRDGTLGPIVTDTNLDGPYWFWDELGPSAEGPLAGDSVVVVYSDNNGYAYVTLDSLAQQGSAVITATADYPYLRKHPAMKSDEVTQTWGPPLVETVTWDFPHGLLDDASAVFLRHYDGTDVSLPAGEPTELLAVWFYDEGAMAWYYYVPGWESTLTDLEFCNTYMVIVTEATTWDIPQP